MLAHQNGLLVPLESLPEWLLPMLFGGILCSLVYQMIGLAMVYWQGRTSAAARPLVPSSRGGYRVLQFWGEDEIGPLISSGLGQRFPKVVEYDNGEIEHWTHPGEGYAR